MRRAAILQPSYLSWPGHFHWMSKADVFVFLDDVQFTRQDWRNRNYIKTTAGRTLLTVPVHWYGNSYAPINAVDIDNTHDWAAKHAKSIRFAYSKAPFFDRYMGYFEGVYSRDWEHIAELDMVTMRDLAAFLGLEPQFAVSSQLCPAMDDSSAKLVELCRAVGADTYIAGRHGYEHYIDKARFEEADIAIEVYDYEPRPYPQLWGDFEPYVSVVDMLFNCGPKARDLIAGQQTGGPAAPKVAS